MLELRALAYEFGGLITQLVLCAFRRGWLSEAGHHQEAHPSLSGGGGGLVTKSCLTLLQPHVPCQAPLPMEFSKQGYWSGLPFPSPSGVHNSAQIQRPESRGVMYKVLVRI